MDNFMTIFEKASEASFYDTLKTKKDINNIDKTEIVLDSSEVVRLARNILILSDPCTSMFFLNYVYRFDYETIENMLDVTEVEGYLNYFSEILASGFGLSSNERIAQQSMEEACNMALEHYCDELFKSLSDIEPIYSKKFKKSMKKIVSSKAINDNTHPFMKKVAVAALITLLGTAGTFTFSATAREKFIDWVVGTYPKFSSFFIKESSEADWELTPYEINYIPQGFELSERFTDGIMIAARYQKNDLYISLRQKLPDDAPFNLNTEGVELETFIYEDREHIYWIKSDVHSLVWEQKGNMFNLIANTDKDTFIEVFKSIKKIE